MSGPFTPGPWCVVDNRSLNGAFWICHPDEFTSHAEVRAGCGEAEDIGSPEANARLIASAPELYDGCNAMLGLVQLILGRDDLSDELREVLTTNHRIHEAKAATAKASGDIPSGRAG